MLYRSFIKLVFIAICFSIVSCEEDEQEEIKTIYHQDYDGDGFGNPEVEIEAVDLPVGYAENNSDCDDSNKNINPEAIEVFNNSIDENCDGEISKKESYAGDVILLTQQDVDDFGRHNYKTIYGRLQIGKKNEPNTSIVSLAPLQNLRVVRQESSVYIYSNHALKTLEGLNKLSSIEEGFYIEDNILLENLDELTNINQIGYSGSLEMLSIKNNPSLTSIKGFENLTKVYNIEIADNLRLYDFCSLEVVKSLNFPLDHDVYNPESIFYSFNTSGNKWNPDTRAIKEGLCAYEVNRSYGDYTLDNTNYLRYVFLKKGDELTSIEGILTDFGTSQVSDVQAYTYQIGETANWYLLKIPQDDNEKSNFYDLIIQSGFYDPEPFSMKQDNNYASTVIGLGLQADEAYIIYEDRELRSDLRYPNPGDEYGAFGTWFGTFQNDESFVLPATVYQEAAYPEIKGFSELLEEFNIELNTLGTMQLRDFEILKRN